MYAIRPGGLLLFVPRFHIRTAVHLQDRDGVVREILADENEEHDDPYAKADRRSLKLESGVGICFMHEAVVCSPEINL